MDAEANKDLVRAYVEAFNRFDMPALREMFASDARIYGVLGYGGLDDVEPIWHELHEGMNINLEILDIAAEGQMLSPAIGRQVAIPVSFAVSSVMTRPGKATISPQSNGLSSKTGRLRPVGALATQRQSCGKSCTPSGCA